MTLTLPGNNDFLLIVALGVPSLYALYSAVNNYRSKKAFTKYTAVDELSILGKSRVSPPIDGTAVVVGGSFAGLFTALACSRHFKRVVIIEADEGADTEVAALSTKELPGGAKGLKTKRTRLWQANALHLFQPFTLYSLRRWFPNFDEKAKENGHRVRPYQFYPYISCLPLAGDCLTADEIGLPKHPNLASHKRMEAVWGNRWNLEPLVRRLLLEHYDNIEIITGIVNGVVLDPTPHVAPTAEGVTYMVCKENKVHTIPAALVIDCTGAANSGVKWLARAGLEPPKVTSFNPDIGYGGILFKVPPEVGSRLPIPGGWQNAEWFYSNMSNSKYGADSMFCTRADFDRIFVGFGGWGTPLDSLPHSPDEIKDYHRRIPAAKGAPPPDEWVCDMIDMLCEGNGWEEARYSEHHITDCTLVEYHNYADLPSNFIAIGDSVMKSSPIYGLGTTKACVGAATLEGLLHEVKGRKLPEDFAKSFIAKQHDRTIWSWEQSKTGDYCFPTTIPVEGEKLEDSKTMENIAYRMLRICNRDPKAAARFYHGRSWIYPATEGFSTWTLIRALFYWAFVE